MYVESETAIKLCFVYLYLHEHEAIVERKVQVLYYSQIYQEHSFQNISPLTSSPIYTDVLILTTHTGDFKTCCSFTSS